MISSHSPMATTILNAQIVLPDGVHSASLRFDARRILSLDRPPSRGDAVLDYAGCYVYPGLINAHDHLELNHYPRSKFRDVYANAHDWGEDFRSRLDEEPFVSLRRLPLAEQCRIGGVKNLGSGVTTVAHHNPLHPPLRRADFPVRVGLRFGWAHSLHFTAHEAVRRSYRRTPQSAPWMIHLAEGTDEVAAAELRQLDRLGCLGANTVLIHGVGLSAADRAGALERSAGLVWCPSTNLYLLGATATVSDFAAAGRLALGTDSRLTADGDMFDELRAAHAIGQLTPAELFRAVTTDAARLLRLTDVGALLPGYRSDFFVAPILDPDPYANLLLLTPRDLHGVFVGGWPVAQAGLRGLPLHR